MNKKLMRVMQGAFIGDALGGVLEFQPFITKSMVDKAFEFPGGGMLKLAPFQITDDSEMTISQLKGIIDGGKQFSLNDIAKNYKIWYLT